MSYTDGLIHTVDVQLTDGTAKGVRGGAKPAYTVVATNVPARMTTPKPSEVEAFAKRDVRIDSKVMLPPCNAAPGMRLTNKHRLIFTEAVTNRKRTLVVHAAYDPHEMGRMYIALCEEDES